MTNEWVPLNWKRLTPGKRLILFYVLFFVFFGVITLLLFLLDGVDIHLREAMVILLAAIFGNLLYDLSKMAFDIKRKEDYEKMEADDKKREDRLKNIERIVEQWDMEKR